MKSRGNGEEDWGTKEEGGEVANSRYRWRD